MPKRKHEESKEDKWRRKLKKYEKRLKKKRYRHFESSNEDEPYSAASSEHLFPIRSESPRPVNFGDITPTAAGAAITTPPHLPPAAAVDPPPVADTATTTPPVTSEVTTAPAKPTDEPTSMDSSELPAPDPELLQALGIFEAESTEWGRDIISDLAKRWEPLLKDGLKKETREELIKKHLYPKNCPLAKPPVLNPEIAAMLNESAKNRDKRVFSKQGQLGCILSILGRTMSDILTKSIDTSEVLRLLADAAKLLADSHYLETETRRSLITPMVDKTFIEPFKDRKRDSYLFGEKLSDLVKSSRFLQKTGKLIQSTSNTTNSNLNWKNPSSSRNQQQRGSRAQANRGGGGNRTANYRRGRDRGPPRAPRVTSPPATAPSQRHKPASSAATSSAKQKQ